MTKDQDILAQVVAGTLDAISHEMSAAVTRTSRSPLFNEAHDFTTGIFDLTGARARLVAQAPGCTLHIYAVVSAVEHVVDAFRHDLHPGDVILANDPYHGGSHSLDWTLLTPVFYKRKPILLPVVRAHQGDNGGSVAGGYNPRSRDIWQDGLRIPPLKIYERGEKRRDVFDLVVANNRLAHWLEGDLDAMIGACRIAARRIESLLERHGGDAIKTAIDQSVAYTERRVRQEIGSWPDGTYVGEAFADHDYQGNRDIKIWASVTVKGSDLHVDFSGSSPQTAGFVNSPIANTTSFVFVAVSTCCDEDIPINEGYMNPVTVTAPEGSVVNPVLPAPCGHATACVGAEVAEATLLALSQCAPKRVGGNVHKLPLVYTHGAYDDGRPWVNLNFWGYTGGAGAAYGVDGWGLYPPVMTGVTLPSIEMNEVQYPCRIRKHEYAPDATGPGRWRGAPGLDTEIEYLDGSRSSVMMAGVRNTTRGLCEGGDAPPNRVIVDFEERPQEVAETAFDLRMERGGAIYFRRAGGGGWGDPLTRPPEEVLEDVRNDYVSIEGALSDYGVALESDGLTIDWRKTESERSARRRRR